MSTAEAATSTVVAAAERDAVEAPVQPPQLRGRDAVKRSRWRRARRHNVRPSPSQDVIMSLDVILSVGSALIAALSSLGGSSSRNGGS